MTFKRHAETPVTQAGHHSLWVPPRYGVLRETIYVVTQEDLGRVDLIAHKAYSESPGAERKWWVILHYNKVSDPFSLKVGDRLVIPHWTGFQGENTVIQREPVKPVFQPLKAIVVPPYLSPLTEDADTTVLDPAPQSVNNTLLNFSFPLPTLGVGKAHIQLQLSPSGEFDNIVLSKMTQTSTARWYHYDHTANSGNGGHRQFPVSGLDSVIFEGKLVYFKIEDSDNLVRGMTYFPRYKVFLNDIDGEWVATPPIIIPND